MPAQLWMSSHGLYTPHMFVEPMIACQGRPVGEDGQEQSEESPGEHRHAVLTLCYSE